MSLRLLVSEKASGDMEAFFEANFFQDAASLLLQAADAHQALIFCLQLRHPPLQLLHAMHDYEPCNVAPASQRPRFKAAHLPIQGSVEAFAGACSLLVI